MTSSSEEPIQELILPGVVGEPSFSRPGPRTVAIPEEEEENVREILLPRLLESDYYVRVVVDTHTHTHSWTILKRRFLSVCMVSLRCFPLV